MAHKYLGESFDIHGGGLDLVFPHHENEIAQSKCAGDGFANYWLHNAWVTTAGEKMSKSLGNSLLVSEVVQRVRPIELRYYLAGAHYRSTLEFSDEMVTDAGQGFQRIEGFITRAIETLELEEVPVDGATRAPAFDEAMDDDINTPQAIAVIHGVVREGNTALAAGDRDAAHALVVSVVSMLDALGLNPLAEHWMAGRDRRPTGRCGGRSRARCPRAAPGGAGAQGLCRSRCHSRSTHRHGHRDRGHP